MAENKKFKITIAGDGGVGKTTYVKRLISGEFERSYVPTLGVEVRPLHFQTNYGKVTFNVWDTAGQEKFGGLKDGYYILSKGAIVMFDVTNRLSYRNVQDWYDEVKRVCGDIPFVLCGNKCDIRDRQVLPRSINFHRCRENMVYYDVSAKSNFNFEKPFLHLARKLTGKNDLEFIEENPVIPPGVGLDMDKIREYELELELARAKLLPED